MRAIHVTVNGGAPQALPSGTVVGSLLPPGETDGELPYLAALVNNDVASLSYPLTVNSRVRFLTMADPHGWRVYRRSLCFLLAKAVRDLFPQAVFAVEHSFGLGLYCSFSDTSDRDATLVERVAQLEAHMRRLSEQDLPFERRKISYADAVRDFEAAAEHEKNRLLAHRNPPRVVVHVCRGFVDLAHGPLTPSSGCLSRFRLIPYPPGFVLHLPDRARPADLPPFEDQPHLFRIFQEHKEWGRILGVGTAGKLNEIVAADDAEDFIHTAEALHEKKLAQIADRIGRNRKRLKVLLIAGPSCAGKTTFAKRLATQLRVNGIRTATVAMDDYFVGRDRTPRDEQGKLDFEHLEAVDLELFNAHLLALIDGQEVKLPRFLFATSTREYRDTPVRIADDQMIIIEGIHGLNPRLTERVPGERKFRVYISALTQLAVDRHNRVSTTDNRLMRRLVRDRLYRGYPALETLRRWPSVRRGEKRWIFPFQQQADETFNSALDYELAVLKPKVEPLLMQVKPMHEEYAEARRLSEFLLNFLALDDNAVPPLSILREYIGGSRFRY